MAASSLSGIRDCAVNTFTEWLDRHRELLFTDADEKKNRARQRELRQLMKIATRVRDSESIPDLLGFALWVQNMLAMWGVNFGMGIVGEPVKSFHLTNPNVDEECSRRFAQALADMLQLQFM